MPDLSKTIIAKSDQLNADDLIGGPVTIRITNVSAVPGEQPIAVNFDGDNGKPWKPCKSMRRVLVHLWGTDGKSYIGRSLTLYRDPDVLFGGIKVGGIRISHASHINGVQQMALTERRGAKKAYSVKPLASAPTPKAQPAANVNMEQLRMAAQENACGGTEALRAWFQSLSVDQKKAMQPEMDEYKALAAQYDSPEHIAAE